MAGNRFLDNLWKRPFYTLIVVCVFLSIITMIVTFIRNQFNYKNKSSSNNVNIKKAIKKNSKKMKNNTKKMKEKVKKMKENIVF